MATRKSSRVNRRYKTRYRVQNWPEYERGLRSRGDVTLWFSDEAVAAWTPPPTGLRGGQRQYSNLAILTSLTLRLVFHLPLRQTEGFVGVAAPSDEPGPEGPGPLNPLPPGRGRGGVPALP